MPGLKSDPERTARHMTRTVVNADDWGADAESTNAISRCFESGAISRTSGMVYMADSERAADIALREELPVGLHVNLTTPFDGRGISSAVRTRHERVTRAFRRSRLRGTRWHFHRRRWLTDPDLLQAVRICIEDQIAGFRELYGRKPSHFDGHHDVHRCPTVLHSGGIPAGAQIRRYQGRVRLRHGLPSYWTTDAFFSIRDFAPWGNTRLNERIDRARWRSLEISCHPKLGELDYLLSPTWKNELAGLELVASTRFK
jgi:predicted glycoside hydrolase/deacetylase ChbG (UPF0249 family)